MTGLLMEKRFGVSMLDIYMGKDIKFSSEQTMEWEDILRRLQRYEPVQYIIGETDFYGLSFKVNKNVLIPRPETTELIEWIMQGKDLSSYTILDIGTGSGCIPIVLSKHFPFAEIHAWDISAEALEVAQENNLLNGTSVRFRQVDVLSGGEEETEHYDLIVSNPPYVTQSEKKEMEPNVLEWEPEQALFVPDDNPLIFYRRIAQLGLQLLKPAGMLYFEINRTFGLQIKEMLSDLGYRNLELKKDISGNDRMVKAIL